METSESRRIAKKHKRHIKVFEKSSGVTCVDYPSKNLGICNAGLVNGLTYEDVFDNFSKFGPIELIQMIPEQSYAFVCFKCIDSSVDCYNTCNGKLNLAQNNKPLYLVYVEKVPESFHQDTSKPDGLIILENFVSETEEKLLLNAVDLKEGTNTLKHRQVKHFGYEFRYDINNVDKNCPLKENIPEECNFLWKKLKEYNSNFENFQPDQLTVNCYKSGQGIPSHVDTHSAFTDNILVLSLGSQIVMEFRKQKQHLSVLLPQRSLAIFSDECRYNWCHGITPRKTDIISTNRGLTVHQRGTRTSFTFRKVRNGECDCLYTDMCDSFQRKQKIDDISAVNLEKNYVLDVYNTIADHFSDTRHKQWPKVTEFIESFDVGSVLVDAGCGNGKYLTNNKIYSLGFDTSLPLLEVCKNRGFEIFTCSCLNIPLKDNSSDGAISIAVIHHLATENRRLQAINEIIRILKPGGRVLIYVWAKDQNRNQIKSSYLKQGRKNCKEIIGEDSLENNLMTNDQVSLPIHNNRKQFQHQDVLVPWKLKNEKKQFLRFYHVYDENELENTCKKLLNIEIVNCYYDQGNWCIILKKIK